MAAMLSVIPLSAQIPNPGLESWTDCDPDNWATSNVCGVLLPVTKSANAHSGSAAARGEVVAFFGTNVGPILQSGAGGEGFAISQRYPSVRLFYMFSPVGGDRFAVNIAFFKGQSPVGQGAVALPAAVAVYAQLEVPITYTSNDVPDSATIQISIIGPVTGSDFHPASVMFVDDLSFGTNTPPPPVPSLTIERRNQSLVISWPHEALGFTLQSTPALPTTTWTDIPGTAPDNSYEFSPTTQAFFRLFKP